MSVWLAVAAGALGRKEPKSLKEVKRKLCDRDELIKWIKDTCAAPFFLIEADQDVQEDKVKMTMDIYTIPSPDRIILEPHFL